MPGSHLFFSAFLKQRSTCSSSCSFNNHHLGLGAYLPRSMRASVLDLLVTALIHRHPAWRLGHARDPRSKRTAVPSPSPKPITATPQARPTSPKPRRFGDALVGVFPAGLSGCGYLRSTLDASGPGTRLARRRPRRCSCVCLARRDMGLRVALGRLREVRSRS